MVNKPNIKEKLNILKTQVHDITKHFFLCFEILALKS